VDVGLSVSRVGGSAQFKAIRKTAGRLRLDLAQYREMAAFAQFGSDLDKATQTKLAQGERLMEVLKQPHGLFYTTAQQYAILYASVNGHLLDINTGDIPTFVKGYLNYLDSNHKTLMEILEKTGESSAETDEALTEALENYKHVRRQS